MNWNEVVDDCVLLYHEKCRILDVANGIELLVDSTTGGQLTSYNCTVVEFNQVLASVYWSMTSMNRYIYCTCNSGLSQGYWYWSTALPTTTGSRAA